jgi:hypothetical protein
MAMPRGERRIKSRGDESMLLRAHINQMEGPQPTLIDGSIDQAKVR